MKASRLKRLLELIVRLQAGQGRNSSGLALELNVSRRTVFRDLELLRQAGVPLHYHEPTQMYHLVGGFILPPTSFTTEEALALLLLCRELGGIDGVPGFEPASRAALKLESCLPAPIRDYLRDVAPALRIQPEPHNRLAGQQQFFQLTLNSIRSRHCLRLHYESYSDDTLIRTKLSPYQLLFCRRSWYVIGRSSCHRAIRTFNLGRIRELEPLVDTFEPPRLFDLDRFLRNAWHMIAEPGPDHHVVVRFERLVARNVAEIVWHKTQRIEFHPDGSCDFHVDVSGLNEISWWVLGYGDQATVLEPPPLRAMIAQRVRRMADRYRGHRPRRPPPTMPSD